MVITYTLPKIVHRRSLRFRQYAIFPYPKVPHVPLDLRRNKHLADDVGGRDGSDV